ncbi:MAG: hypothetical protein ABEJ64_03700 [Candidatus Nanohaloarchaea archaeon]
MKRTVSGERVPEPLRVSVDKEDVKADMVAASGKLSSMGYGGDFMYQAGFISPPVDEGEDIVEELGSGSVYVTLAGIDDVGSRSTEQVYPGYTLEGVAGFEDVAGDIEQVVDSLGYDLEFWQVNSVSTSAQSGSAVAERLDGMPLQATAAVDAGLESQREENGFQPINIGWFYTAPMNHDMQFGYRAFPNREFDHEGLQGKRDEEVVVEILGRLTGERDSETNLHDLSGEETRALVELEEEMNRAGLL